LVKASGTINPYSVNISPPAKALAQKPKLPSVVTLWLQATNTERSLPMHSEIKKII
jgi:hypothetical protein